MPKHIAGNPNMIVQNMPGAGGLAATNYLYGMAKADGLTLGMFQAHRYMQQLTGVEEVKFDLRKFNWIGTMEKTEVMFLSVQTRPISLSTTLSIRASRFDVAQPGPLTALTCWQTGAAITRL